jgi:hypothetical protein
MENLGKDTANWIHAAFIHHWDQMYVDPVNRLSNLILSAGVGSATEGHTSMMKTQDKLLETQLERQSLKT